MKLHRSLVQTISHCLQQIFEEGQYADRVVELALKQDARWGSRDRRFIAENVYGMVRWWRLINELEGSGQCRNYYRLFAIWQVLMKQELPAWEEFAGIDPEALQKRYTELTAIRKIRESVPDWLDRIGSEQLGEEVWEKELHALNEQAKVVLRTNTLKTSRMQLQKLLAEENIETDIISDYPDALILRKRQNLAHLPEYKQGFFEVQDASSQLIAPFLELEPGMTVIDACAGAGGKSLHIAAMMKNKGKIISMDVEERKLKELEKRAQRNGAQIISTRLAGEGAVSALKGSADRLLLDVPCSGLGVLRRNPDAKWKLSESFIEEVRNTQQQIISSYSSMLKQGGLMVYATCSLLPSENQEQVKKFLEGSKGAFELLGDRKVMPSVGFDGFYMAALKRIKE